MWIRIVEILKKEIRVVLREPRMRLLLFGPPLIQLIIFGYAVNLDVEKTRLAWLDQDRSPQSRELRARLEGSSYFHVVRVLKRSDDASRLLDGGEARAVVRVPDGFARDILRGRTAKIQILIDGTDSNTASIVSGYLNRIISAYNGELQRLKMTRGFALQNLDAEAATTPGLPAVRGEVRIWFNPDLESRNYFVPGVVVNIIGLITVMLTAMAVVREKEIGTMEQLMVTPIRPLELMLGKTLPFAAIGLIEVVLITAAALLVFEIPFRGSPLLLMAAAALFVMTTLGAGLLISTVSSTQQQAMMGSFFFFMPAFLLSGFTFPLRNMPEPVQYVTYLNPMRYFLEIVWGIFLKGTGIAVLWPQMLTLAVIGAAMVIFSSLRFRNRLD